MPDPSDAPDLLLVDAVAVGICGTDREIIAGHYGEAPGGEERLILGHESLGRVRRAPPGSGFHEGQLVAGIVRRPDPEPCRSCGAGEWDMCENGRYTERGIKGLQGYASEQFTLEPAFAFAVPESVGREGVLLEPASVVAKAWEQIDRIASRATFRPTRVLVTGAGPVGLLAALIAQQRGHEVHVLDRVAEGLKPELVRALGATYHAGSMELLKNKVDVVVECTGAAAVVVDALSCTGPNGIVCLAGISSGSRRLQLQASALNDELVMENGLVFGTVNANRRHFEAAATALERADRDWLARMITRRVPIDDYRAAFEHQPNDIKTVLEFQ